MVLHTCWTSHPLPAAGAAGKAPEVLNRGNGWTSAAEAEAIALEDPAVAELIDCGYPLPEVMRAVAEGSGAVEAARRLLFAMLTGLGVVWWLVSAGMLDQHTASDHACIEPCLQHYRVPTATIPNPLRPPSQL